MTEIAEAIRAHQEGDLGRAERIYRKLIRKNRHVFHAKHLLGVLHFQYGRFDEAERLIKQALTINANDDSAYYHHGMVLSALNKHQDAVASFSRAIAINPQNAQAHNNRGVALLTGKQYSLAIASFEEAIALDPQLVEAQHNRQNAINALVIHGNELFEQNRDGEALACYDKAIAAKPDHAEANFNKGLLKLSLGEYAEGWRLYEWRWKMRSFARFVKNYHPLWQGDADLTGKTIFIDADQGMGDAIQFSRYLALLRARNCQVIFEVHKPLVPLFRDHGIKVIARGDFVPTADALPPFDFHCPLASLPSAFGTTIETIPAPRSYITASTHKVALWGELLGPKIKPRIGLVWSGNPQLGHDHRRSVRLETLLPIIDEAVEWFSLQKEVREYDREILTRTTAIRDFSDQLNDFADTAALTAHMDVVISVDTSVAHLAGALGKPIWLLLSFHPDFRWLRERTDSPWYQTATLFRQTKDGEWSDVLAKLSSAVRSQLRR